MFTKERILIPQSNMHRSLENKLSVQPANTNTESIQTEILARNNNIQQHSPSAQSTLRDAARSLPSAVSMALIGELIFVGESSIRLLRQCQAKEILEAKAKRRSQGQEAFLKDKRPWEIHRKIL